MTINKEVPIYLYNSLSNTIEPFIAITPLTLKMYMCGITVYDYCHIGHARGSIVLDVFSRFLKYLGYTTTLVRNITDVDDKIIQRAQDLKITASALTTMMIAQMEIDFAALNVLKPDHEPRATAYMAEIIEMIQHLITHHYAYRCDQGDVYFDVTQLADYGKLSNQKLDKLQQHQHGKKRHPQDFALWKASTTNPCFASPFGLGRPGWHIECSAMAAKLCGPYFDVHVGGLDLIFPHHENEIAQSTAVYGCCPARYWMHIGLLKINQQKMSKSLHNHILLRDVLQEYEGNVIRMMMLKSHYRKPINFKAEALASHQTSLTRIYHTLKLSPKVGYDIQALDSTIVNEFLRVLAQDLNTPAAMALVFSLVKQINKNPQNHIYTSTLYWMLELLGFELS